MNRLYPLILLIVAGLCFYAGYTIGLKKAPNPASAQPVEASTPIVVETAEPVKVAEPEPVDVATETMVLDHEQSLRAAKKQITFTDKQNRELVAEVVEANLDSLKVRRIQDNQVVNLPINMLCDADQAFALYLAKQPSTAPMTQSMEDKIWDELFK